MIAGRIWVWDEFEWQKSALNVINEKFYFDGFFKEPSGWTFLIGGQPIREKISPFKLIVASNKRKNQVLRGTKDGRTNEQTNGQKLSAEGSHRALKRIYQGSKKFLPYLIQAGFVFRLFWKFLPKSQLQEVYQQSEIDRCTERES